ncbi:MAG: hypothetical protein IE936_09720 [Moraxella osloensis]|nr:hypothetical protein [Moraxella osloensis]
MAAAVWEAPLKNAALSFLGAMIEPTSEVAQGKSRAAETVVQSATQPQVGFAANGAPAITPQAAGQINPIWLWGGVAVAVLLVVVLLFVAMRGGK